MNRVEMKNVIKRHCSTKESTKAMPLIGRVLQKTETVARVATLEERLMKRQQKRKAGRLQEVEHSKWAKIVVPPKSIVSSRPVFRFVKSDAVSSKTGKCEEKEKESNDVHTAIKNMMDNVSKNSTKGQEIQKQHSKGSSRN